MLVHAVYFWLKADLTDAQRARFERGLGELATIASAKVGFVGRPAATDRPVIDRSYTFALTVVFDHLAAHDAYQQDPVHLRFLDDCRTFWDRVVIYDSTNDR